MESLIFSTKVNSVNFQTEKLTKILIPNSLTNSLASFLKTCSIGKYIVALNTVQNLAFAYNPESQEVLELRLDVFLLNALKKLECFPNIGIAAIMGEASDNQSKIVILDARNIEEATTRLAAVLSMTSNGFECKGIEGSNRIIFSCISGAVKQYKTYFFNGPITLVKSTVAGVSASHQLKLKNIKGEGQ